MKAAAPAEGRKHIGRKDKSEARFEKRGDRKSSEKETRREKQTGGKFKKANGFAERTEKKKKFSDRDARNERPSRDDREERHGKSGRKDKPKHEKKHLSRKLQFMDKTNVKPFEVVDAPEEEKTNRQKRRESLQPAPQIGGNKRGGLSIGISHRGFIKSKKSKPFKKSPKG